jgi:hypothetical protein
LKLINCLSNSGWQVCRRETGLDGFDTFKAEVCFDGSNATCEVVCFDGSNATCEVVDLGGAADSTRLERLDASGTETQGAGGVHADNGRIAGMVPTQPELRGKLRALGATCKNCQHQHSELCHYIHTRGGIAGHMPPTFDLGEAAVALPRARARVSVGDVVGIASRGSRARRKHRVGVAAALGANAEPELGQRAAAAPGIGGRRARRGDVRRAGDAGVAPFTVSDVVGFCLERRARCTLSASAHSPIDAVRRYAMSSRARRVAGRAVRMRAVGTGAEFSGLDGERLDLGEACTAVVPEADAIAGVGHQEVDEALPAVLAAVHVAAGDVAAGVAGAAAAASPMAASAAAAAAEPAAAAAAAAAIARVVGTVTAGPEAPAAGSAAGLTGIATVVGTSAKAVGLPAVTATSAA